MLEERRLLKELIEGSEFSFNALYNLWASRLYHFAFSYLKSDSAAKDVVQETFVKAYRSLNRFRGESCEKTWLIRIAINVCRDIQRTAWFRNLGRMVNLDDVKIPQEMKVKSEVVDQIMRMPKKLREVVLLYYYEDMSQSEIAEVLGAGSSPRIIGFPH